MAKAPTQEARSFSEDKQKMAAPAQATATAPAAAQPTVHAVPAQPSMAEKETNAKATAREKEKRAAFTKLGNKRLAKAIDAIRLLRNLANKNNYSFTEEDRKLMIGAIDKQRNAVNDAFVAALAGKAAETEEEGAFFS